MPVDARDPFAAPPSAAAITRAGVAGARDDARLAEMAGELFLSEDARIDDRLRAELTKGMRATIGAIERELRLGGARRLSDMGVPDAASALLASADQALERLWRTDLLAEPGLMAEWFGAARLGLLARALPAGAAGGPERPSLLVRLAECPDSEVAAAAAALLVADSRAAGHCVLALPPDHRAHLVWAVAAALRHELGGEARADHALCEAALAVLSEPDPEPSVGAASLALAVAVAARPEELPELLVEALGARQPALFVALLAGVSAIGFPDARAITVDVDGARLWLLLRAQGLERTAIARIGVALAAADPLRDLERFADEIDEVVAVSPEAAAAHFATLTLPGAYRRALDALRGRA